MKEYTLQEITELRKQYRAIIDKANEDAARLESEIEESRAAIIQAEEEAATAANAADGEAYQAARNKATMYRQRIEMHETEIRNLKEGHLISDTDFVETMRNVRATVKRIEERKAAAFMNALHTMESIAEEYQKELTVYNGFGRFLQADVYRKREKIGIEGKERIDRMISFGINNFERLLDAINVTVGDVAIIMMYIKNAEKRGRDKETV